MESTYWGRMTHICVGKLTIIGSDNGLSPSRHQAIILTNAGILLIRPLGTNFSEISIGIQTFSFKKMRLKVSSAKWRPSCLGLNVIMYSAIDAPLRMHSWNKTKVPQHHYLGLYDFHKTNDAISIRGVFPDNLTKWTSVSARVKTLHFLSYI